MRAFYDSMSKSLDDRGIKKLFSKDEKISSWLIVEASLAKAQAKVGFIPQAAADNIIANCKLENIDLDEIEKINKKVGHNFVPFLKVLVNTCNEEGGKYVHYGVTTQNIQQTGQLFTMQKIHCIFLSFIRDILNNLAILANDNANTVMPGRTHGKHAVPITYGYKVAVWISELLNALDRLQECEKRVFQVMMGGAVGTFSATGELGKEVQELVAKDLNMYSMPVPSRNIANHKVEYITNLCLLSSCFHKIAEEVYYTGIEEFGEISEAFKPGTIGSSTMPQKINPKLAKGIIANSQKLYSLITPSLYSSIRMFEGDSSSYMMQDGLIEEALELTTEVLIRAEELTRTLYVNKNKMYQNATLSKGLINSEYVMMKIAEKIGKDKAHELVYDKAMQVGIDNKDYLTILLEDKLLTTIFSKEEIEAMIKPENYIGISDSLATKMAKTAKERAVLLDGIIQK